MLLIFVGFLAGLVCGAVFALVVLSLLVAASRASDATEATDAPRESWVVNAAESVAREAWR